MEGTKFVEKGDSIHLICNASGSTSPPEDLDWFKDGIKITADGWKQITIDKFRVQSTKTLVSVLDKKYSDMDDAGTYVCRSSNLGVTSLKVHVLNGEFERFRSQEEEAEVSLCSSFAENCKVLGKELINLIF